MLRKVSLDLCDASEGEFDIPNVSYKWRPLYIIIQVESEVKNYRCCAYLVTLTHDLWVLVLVIGNINPMSNATLYTHFIQANMVYFKWIFMLAA